MNFLVIFLLTLVGCGKAPSGNPSTGYDPSANSNSNSNSNSGGGGLQTTDVTVYTLTKIFTTSTGGFAKQYTATANCFDYNAQTYCWDDGAKTVVWPGFTGTYSYWNVGNIGSGCAPGANANLGTDCTLTPTIFTEGSLSSNIAPSLITQVKAGTVLIVTCTIEVTGDLTCPSFTLDVDQTPL